MTKVTMLKAGVKGFANAVRRMAVKDKKLAEELVFMHGVRSEITPKALKGITKDLFEKGGQLSQKGKAEVTNIIKDFNLPANATWEDALKALSEYKRNIPKIDINFKDLYLKS